MPIAPPDCSIPEEADWRDFLLTLVAMAGHDLRQPLQRMTASHDALSAMLGTERQQQELVDDAENQEARLGEREELSLRHRFLQQALTCLNERERHILGERRLKDNSATLGRPIAAIRRFARAHSPDRADRFQEAANVGHGANDEEPRKRATAVSGAGCLIGGFGDQS
ncbi:MAG: hypothetical protein WB697_22250 [Stellaceae bacterium]